MASGSTVAMSSGVVTRRQNTDTAENNASPFNAPFRPLVSWKAPRPSRVVGAWPISASTGTRLANASPSPATVFKQPPPEVAATTPSPAPLRLYPSAMVAAENSCLARTAVMSSRKCAAS